MLQQAYIGSAPAHESCAQVGTSDYRKRARQECSVFAEQLRRTFGQEPIGARIVVTSNLHDYGTYCFVVVDYDEDFIDAIRYALKIERMTPEYWDREAQRQLSQAGLRP